MASSQAGSLLPGLGCQGVYHVTALSDSTHLRLTYGLTRRDGFSQLDSFSQKLKREAGNGLSKKQDAKTQPSALSRQGCQVKPYFLHLLFRTYIELSNPVQTRML